MLWGKPLVSFQTEEYASCLWQSEPSEKWLVKQNRLFRQSGGIRSFTWKSPLQTVLLWSISWKTWIKRSCTDVNFQSLTDANWQSPFARSSTLLVYTCRDWLIWPRMFSLQGSSTEVRSFISWTCWWRRQLNNPRFLCWGNVIAGSYGMIQYIIMETTGLGAIWATLVQKNLFFIFYWLEHVDCWVPTAVKITLIITHTLNAILGSIALLLSIPFPSLPWVSILLFFI